MLRILMHCPNIPPDISGGGKQAYTLARTLKQLGYEIIFLADEKPNSQEFDETSEFEIHRIKGFRVGGSTFELLLFWLRVFLSLFKLRNRFDILHVHGLVIESAFSCFAGKLLGKPNLIKTSLEGELQYLKKDWKSAKLLYWFLLRTDKIIAISNELADEYKTTSLPLDKLEYIPNGVDQDIYRPISKADAKALAETLGVPIVNDVPLFVYHGVIMTRKAILWVVDQLKDYLRQGKLRLMVIGDPSRHEAKDGYYNKFINYTSSLNLPENLIIRGFSKDIYKYLQISDAYITASMGEGLSNSLLEAMAVGLFPIASNTSGTSQVIDNGVNGFMFECLNGSQFLEAIDQYLNIFNKAEEKNIRRNAVTTIESKFSINNTAKRYADLYKNISE